MNEPSEVVPPHRFVVLLRVSTQKQGADGLGIAAQKRDIDCSSSKPTSNSPQGTGEVDLGQDSRQTSASGSNEPVQKHFHSLTPSFPVSRMLLSSSP